MYRRILLPVDEPSEVEPMIRFGAPLLDADGEIRMLHVIPTTTLPEVTQRWRSSVNLVVPAHEAGAALDVRVDPEVRASVDVPGEILEIAESHGADVILMTLRGDRRSRNPFVGRTASAILHHARCDVLIVNRLGLTADRVPRILVPTFLEAPQPKLMQLAETLAVRNQGAPIVTMVLGAKRPESPSEGGPPERMVKGIRTTYKRTIVPQRILGKRRRLPAVLLAQAARERYGLLLIGEEAVRSEGPLLTRRFLEELFRAAPCPVAALRSASES